MEDPLEQKSLTEYSQGGTCEEQKASREAVRELLKFKKFYTNRNFNFVGLFTQDSKDTNFKMRFSKTMPRRNPMMPPSSAQPPRRRNSCNITSPKAPIIGRSCLSPA